MTTLMLGQAARMTGLGKTTLARAIRAGRLSATRDETGRYSIDGAELARVYPFPAPTEDQDATGGGTDDVVHQATINAQRAALAGEVAALREMLAMMREQLDDTRRDRDEWRDQAQRLALTSPATPKPVEMAPPKPDEKPKTWWQWLRSTG